MPPDDYHKNRRSVRLQGYDYSQAGSYFVTICTVDRACLLGEISGDEMHLSQFGEIVREEWLKTGQLRADVELDEFVIMPNHTHGIITILRELGTSAPCPYQAVFGKTSPGSLSTIVAAFKSVAARRVNRERGTPAAEFWQRNYYEHVIRNDEELDRARQYILTNPLRWSLDKENPDLNSHT